MGPPGGTITGDHARMQKVSIITPTAERADFLAGLYQLLKAQIYTNWEWLIYDTSLTPYFFEDPRICYIHDESPLSIGKKRELLAKKATGEFIIHCDDDDYYGPSYVKNVVKQLQSKDFFGIHAWFSFDQKTKQIYYWATEEKSPTHYIESALTGRKITEFECSPETAHLAPFNKKVAYGFSFAYRREVARVCSFPDCDLGEDWRFFQEVEKQGFKIELIPETKGDVVHVIHNANTSQEFPQYRIPYFLASPVLSSFFLYQKKLDENRSAHC